MGNRVVPEINVFARHHPGKSVSWQISTEELDIVFSDLRNNKAGGYEEIIGNVVESVYVEIKTPMNTYLRIRNFRER